MSKAPLIEVRGVDKLYPGDEAVAALRNINLNIDSGEFTALAGPSGSGKSTLLNLIGTLDEPTHGEIYCRGRIVSRQSEATVAEFSLASLGFIFQAYNLIPVLSAVENVEYPLILRGIDKHERRRLALEALRVVELESYADRRPNLLSGGQQQRVAVARAIVHKPALVLADEPTANLDSKTGALLLDLMETLNRKHDVTFLFSSHDPAVLERARRIVRLVDGEIHADETRTR